MELRSRNAGLWIGLLLAAVLQFATRAAEGPAGLLEFFDGAALHGRLQSMNPDRGVGWEHPEALKQIDFRPVNIASIQFDDVKSITTTVKPTCRFRFRNGDELYGNLASIGEETIELETWFGGSLKAPRDSLRSVEFFWKGFSVQYEGPTGTNGWVMSRVARGWQYRDSSFTTSVPGVLGRDFKLPDSSSIEFDLSWSSPFTMGLTLYTEAVDRFDYSVSAYVFYISPNQVSLQRMQSGAGVTSLGRAEIPSMQRRNKVRLEFRCSREDSTIAVFADGQLAHRWKDASGFVGKGGGVVFSSQMDGPVIRLSNIRVSEWDGRVEMAKATNAVPVGDMAFLANRDKVIGTLKSARDGKLAFSTPQADLAIPMQRVTQLVLGRTNELPVKTGPWEVRAHVAGGGIVAFQLDRWGEQEVAGTSPTFGKLALDPRSIRQLQFNLSRQRSPVAGELGEDELPEPDE